MVRIQLYENESMKSALRRLKKSCEKEGLIKDMKRNEFYEKPCEKRNRTKRRNLKVARESNLLHNPLIGNKRQNSV